MTDSPWDKKTALIRGRFIDKKFGNYYNKPEFATVTTKTGACLESYPAWN